MEFEGQEVNVCGECTHAIKETIQPIYWRCKAWKSLRYVDGQIMYTSCESHRPDGQNTCPRFEKAPPPEPPEPMTKRQIVGLGLMIGSVLVGCGYLLWSLFSSF